MFEVADLYNVTVSSKQYIEPIINGKIRFKYKTNNKEIVKLAERNECTAKEIAEFDALDYPSKVCFTVNKYDYPSTRQIKVANYRRRGAVYNEWKYCGSVYNFAEEANKLIDNRH